MCIRDRYQNITNISTRYQVPGSCTFPLPKLLPFQGTVEIPDSTWYHLNGTTPVSMVLKYLVPYKVPGTWYHDGPTVRCGKVTSYQTILYHIILYCNCTVTRGGVWDEISPGSKGNLMVEMRDLPSADTGDPGDPGDPGHPGLPAVWRRRNVQ